MRKGKRLREQKRIIEKSRELNNNSSKGTIKKGLIISSLILTGITAGYHLFKETYQRTKERALFTEQKSDSRFQEAKANPELRQSYLESLVSSNEIPYSSGVIYDSDGKRMFDYFKSLISSIETNPVEVEIALKKVRQSISDKNTPVKTPEVFDLSGRGIKSPIYVNRWLFESKDPLCLTSEDIAHIIKYHEGRHAEQFSRGLNALGYLNETKVLEALNNRQIEYGMLYTLGELDALNSELVALDSKRSKVSEKLYSKTLNEYRLDRAVFERYSRVGSQTQQALIKTALDQNPRR